jgi:hypothetical protein
MRWQVDLSKKEMPCLGDADAVVHPDHRRQGLLSSMTVSAFNDLADSLYEYIFTLSANRVSAAFDLQVGFRDAGFLQTAQRLRVQSEVPQSSLRRLARKLPVPPSIYRRLRSKRVSAPQESTEGISTFQTFDDNVSESHGVIDTKISFSSVPKPSAMANLIVQIGDGIRIQHVRDQAYFSWRYQNPRSIYRFIFWSSKRGLEGYLVLRAPVKVTDGVVTIVDWVAKSQQVYRGLLQAAIKLGDFYAINIWSESLSKDVKQLLRDNNFRFLEKAEDEISGYRPPQLLVRPVQEEHLAADWKIGDLDLLDFNNWNLRAIDSDGK